MQNIMGKKLKFIGIIMTAVMIALTSCAPTQAPGGSSSSAPGVFEPNTGTAVKIPNFDASTHEDEPEAGQLSVTYLPQGYAILQSANQTMLMDGCAAEDVETVSEALANLGVERLQYIVVPNASEARYGGAQELIDTFHTALVIVPRATAGDDAYQKFIEDNGSKIMEVGVGGTFNVGTCPVEVMGPIVEDTGSSMVLKVTCGEDKFLFTNDATAAELETLLVEPADIKAGTLFLNSRGGDQIPYSVLRLIAPSTIVVTNNDAPIGEEYVAAVYALEDKPYSVSTGSSGVAQVRVPGGPEELVGGNN